MTASVISSPRIDSFSTPGTRSAHTIVAAFNTNSTRPTARPTPVWPEASTGNSIAGSTTKRYTIGTSTTYLQARAIRESGSGWLSAEHMAEIRCQPGTGVGSTTWSGTSRGVAAITGAPRRSSCTRKLGTRAGYPANDIRTPPMRLGYPSTVPGPGLAFEGLKGSRPGARRQPP